MMAPVGIRDVQGFALFYADPGSGALLWQLLGSFVIGLLFYLRRFAAWIHPADGTDKAAPDGLHHEK